MMNYQIHNQGDCGHGRHQSGPGNSCGCSGSGFQRNFKTKTEIKENLENYKEKLKKELEGVEDQLKELSSRRSF